MAEYIDREAAILEIQKFGVGAQDFEDYTPEQAERFVIGRLETIPAADVVPVVRCKDCAEWQKGWEPREAKTGGHFCANVGLITAPEWYCADGNREGGW